MTTLCEIPLIDYAIRPLRELRIDPSFLHSRESVRPAAGKQRSRSPVRLLLGDEPVIATQRFWNSLFRRYGLTDVVFRYFTPAEVFERMSARDAADGLRFAVERPDHGAPRLLAVSAPARPLIPARAAASMVEAYGADAPQYADGRLVTRHVPGGVAQMLFQIGPDAFTNRFTLETPLDGYGDPRIYLTLVRQVCTNGAVAMQRAFTSHIRVGKEPLHALDRALGHYSNDEGFAALRQRFEGAQRSLASVHEVHTLARVMQQLHWGGADAQGAERRQRFRRLAGDLEGIYGIANMDAVSPKRQRLLPAKCRVYDLLNFATEMATHHLPAVAAGKVHGWLGSTIVEEYDLEGSAPGAGDFDALFMQN